MFDLREIHWTATAALRQTDYRHHKGLFMFHKNVANPLRGVSPQQIPESPQTPSSPVRLALVPPGGGINSKESSPFVDLAAIAAHRCSSFLAEAAVLVLVLALLDRFMLKGRMELNWVVSAFTIRCGPARCQHLHGILLPSLAPASLILTSPNALGLSCLRQSTSTHGGPPSCYYP
jgi:hypothetical protein